MGAPQRKDEEEEEDDAAAALSANEAEAEEAGVKVEALLAEGADGGLEPQYLGINTDEAATLSWHAARAISA